MVSSSLALKYAHAFLNYFNDVATYELMLKVEQAACELRKNRDALVYLRAAQGNFDEYCRLLLLFLRSFGVDAFLFPLIQLLAEHKRLFLIDEVLFAMGALYKRKNDIENCFVSSAHELTTAQKKIIEDFIYHKMNKNAFITYTIKPDLIAGIRIQSESFLWDHSVKNKIENLSLLLNGN